MFRFLMLIFFLFLSAVSLPAIEKQLANTDNKNTLYQFRSQINAFKEYPEEIRTVYENLQQILQQLNISLDELPQTPQKTKPKKLDLNIPTEQPFSIHNVEIGDTKEVIEHHVGKAQRSSLNEYGVNWYTYHENYHNFFMVMYDQNNKVSGLYTNQDVISSAKEIKLGTAKQNVRKTLGEPLTQIQKGLMIYQIQEKSDYDVYLLDGVYVTIFYDKYEDNKVAALLLVRKDIEQKKTAFYTKASPALEEGFEYQLFDLTNASRLKHQLSALTWDQHVRDTARKHSTDMAENQYFDHTNLEGQSPFDRMKEDDVIFQMAGENLAYGQFSSIFAHEGLMNSLGHRKNILQRDYQYLGVGVAFNTDSQPYYTENFYAK